MALAVGFALLHWLADLAVAEVFDFLVDLAIEAFGYYLVVAVLALVVFSALVVDVDSGYDFVLADLGYFLDLQAFPLDFVALHPP